MRAFLDANIFVYATGNDEESKLACLSVIEFAESSAGGFVTSAEVMQEVFNVALRRNQPGRVVQVLQLFVLAIGGKIEPVYGSDVLAAAQLASGNSSLQARDLVHLAVMNRLGIAVIVSSDRAFDRVQGIARLDPLEFDSWRSSVFA
ncbi:MAG: type II toxin-antitoxin system VapC family toxin [Tepidiformaceae bacterium]